MKKIFITIMAIVSTLSPLASHANEIDPKFYDISMGANNNLWETNDEWLTELESKKSIFGAYWRTKVMLFFDYLLLGPPVSIDYTSELYTVSPIPNSISSLRLNMVYTANDLMSYVAGADLVVSKNEDFSDPLFVIHHDTSEDTYPHLWYFDIPVPAPNLYYKFLITTKSVQEYSGSNKVKDGSWLKLEAMAVYWAEVLAQPSISVSPNQNGEYTLMSESGELHALIVEYDKDGNVVKNHTPIYPNETQPVAARTVVDGLVDLDDTSWRNKVAGNGETFSIPAPETEGDYMLVRAKSVYRTNQSEELLRFVTTGGVTTGVKCIDTDQNSSSPEYYTLSGIPVAKPANGIYIRVKDGKAEKVRL